ncbi:hypothetical protein [Prevotella sp. OH937_COT-195]|uniref:hypothetical protein n=1 Tax=Prevotella sp. OH937_COT-195 TaxID=2491051 RepID=UPI000F64EAC2|nr:hypothetical protein [Prevotella sp. OH937_COT-195]RRC99520.1 hypothetical protein EII32_07900 [Prevotella sp. OH937_COT-195]
MEIKCIKCRFKYDVTINENQQEATVICPRCGAIQTAMQAADVPQEPVRCDNSQSSVNDNTPPPFAAGVPPIPEMNGKVSAEHRKYMPNNETEKQTNHYDASTEPPKDKPRKETGETAQKSAATPVPPKKDSSCAKKFALGCLVVALLAILTIAVIAFTGKKLFNKISTVDNDEKEQVETNNNNVTIQQVETETESENAAGTENAREDATTKTDERQQVTNTGNEGNGNTSVIENTEPDEEHGKKTEGNVAKTGGSYKCKGKMADNDVRLELNITSGGFVSGKLTYSDSETSLEIIGDKYNNDFFLTASNNNELIKITLKKEGKTMKGTAKKGLQNMPVEVTF